MKRFLASVLAMALVMMYLPALAVTINDPDLPDGEKYQYQASTTVTFNLREEADRDSKKIREIKKGSTVYVVEYGDEWCLIEQGNYQGYAQTSWLFMFKTTDPYKYPIHGYDAPYGMGEMLEPFHTKKLAGNSGNYSGNELAVGQKLAVHRYDSETDVATILVWKSYIDLPAGTVKVTKFVPYDEAKPGDMIAGYTTYMSSIYGRPYHFQRQHNIALVIKKLQGAEVKSGELFSFLSYAAPVTSANGYKYARVAGGDGFGYGGGICQISVLTRSAILALPVIVKAWYMHQDEGTVYTTQICDATVGTRRDFTFYNMLDYPISMEYSQDGGDPGVMNLFIYRAE